jgi:NAD(P) transhydrogenase
VGVESDSRGRIPVDKDFRTKVPTIFAVGDVIGFPSLASVSMEQGRIASARAFGDDTILSNPSFYPYGIYTIPEISFIGKTEEQLTEEDVPYEVGVAYYREIARGQIRGDTTGRLKIIFHRLNRSILGVHIIGEGASELLHIGQAVMASWYRSGSPRVLWWTTPLSDRCASTPRATKTTPHWSNCTMKA